MIPIYTGLKMIFSSITFLTQYTYLVKSVEKIFGAVFRNIIYTLAHFETVLEWIMNPYKSFV